MKNIRKIILSAAVCAVFLTACSSKKTSETSAEKISATESVAEQTEAPTEVTATENTVAETTAAEEMTKEQTAPTESNIEEFDVEVPENAVYRQTELNYIHGKLSAINFNFFDDHDNIIYYYTMPTEDSNAEWQMTYDISYSYKYNDNGTVAEMRKITPNFVQWLTQFEYNANKTVSKETQYRSGELWYAAVYSYDEHSNPVQKEVICADGCSDGQGNVSVMNYEYEYDSDGRISAKRTFNDKGVGSIESYTYDENGNIASLENSTLLTKYTYNSDNRLIKKECFVDGEEAEYTEYEYEFYN